MLSSYNSLLSGYAGSSVIAHRLPLVVASWACCLVLWAALAAEAVGAHIAARGQWLWHAGELLHGGGIFLDQASTPIPCVGGWILIYYTTREVQ